MLRNTKRIDFSDSEEVPEEIEHDLIKDSVLEIAKADFTIDEVEDLPLGSIRKAVSDADYEGKPVSRKKFETRNWIDKGTDEDESESEEDSFGGSILNDSEKDQDDFSGESENDNDEANESIAESEVDDEEGSSEDNEDSHEFGSEDVEMDEGMDAQEEGSEDEEEKPETFEGINIFSDKVKDVESDIKKGKAIKNQLLIWEHLIESRIKFQKAVQSCNTFYQPDKYQDFVSQLSNEELETIKTAEKKFEELLEVLLQVDATLLKNSSDYQKFRISEEKVGNISQTEEDDDAPAAKRTKVAFSKKLRVDGSLKKWRDSVLETWNDRARLAAPRSARFSILEGSILRQLENSLADHSTLIARTRIKRGGEPVLGKVKNEQTEPVPEIGQDHHRTKVQEEDPEIFNDDDFYHKLLKDFIDRKTSNITDPSQLGREWTKLEKMRTKLKRTVDTRATKGRRLRYTVHQKLINFMAPIKYWTMDDAVEADLFRSLFGQAATVSLPSKNTEITSANVT